jgi:pSer/pThr/pTyr-binding forkhead associated (FHA) protein
VSAIHCELVLADGAVLLRDLESTNGTFVGGQRVREVKLTGGETVRLGDVELFVESADTTVAIPKFLNTELPAPPVVATDGGLYCPRHAKVAVTFQCTVCKEVMCDACVHTLRRKGGKNVLLLCPICSNAVEPLGGAKKSPKKKSLLARVGETVKLKFTRGIRVGDGR